MKLEKRNIHTGRIVPKIRTQLTVDDNFIVPDVKPDIDRIIAKDCIACIESVTAFGGKAYIKGTLEFKLLYGCSANSVNNIRGSIIFEEPINCDGIKEGEMLRASCRLESVNIGVINTRKISVRGVLAIEVVSEDIYDIETATDICGSDREKGKCDCLRKKMDIVQVAVNKKDVMRIKDEMSIGNNKPNIGELLWCSLKLKNYNVRPLGGVLAVSGEMSFFALYRPVEEESPIGWVENTISFSENLEVSGCGEDMIPYVSLGIESNSFEIRSDYEGEARIIAIDAGLKLDIRIYREEEIEFLSDIYSCVNTLTPEFADVTYNRLLVRNISKCRIQERIKPEGVIGSILQVCNSDGEVRITGSKIAENGIEVEGMVESDILYISDDDRFPLCVTKAVARFKHLIEVNGIRSDSIYYIRPYAEQMQVVMSGGMEVELKTNVVLDALVFENIKEKIITNVTESPIDMEMLNGLPGITGYMVKRGDTLWSIAKENYTTVESIKEINGIKTDNVKTGDIIIIVKQVNACRYNGSAV